MAIDTQGYITVAEAATRLGLSIEQVRRKLRDGKLRGHRVGNQWFVEEASLRKGRKPLIPPEVMAEVARMRDEANEYARRQGFPPFDVVEMLRKDREEH